MRSFFLDYFYLKSLRIFFFIYFFFIFSLKSSQAGSWVFFHLGRAFKTDRISHLVTSEEKKNVGRLTTGLTYKTAFTDRLIDVNFRFELNSYDFIKNEKRHVKVSLLPLITLPSVDSFFPLYIGFGGGIGTFLSQVYNKTYFTIDYQWLIGFRFIEILGRLGMFIEWSQKNYLFLAEKGKYRGHYLSLGVFLKF